MNVLLKNVRWSHASGEGRGDMRIAGGRIQAMERSLRPLRHDCVLDLTGHTVFPGLINAHDHLGLDLLPRRGRPPYANFYEWARDVYLPDDELQRAVMSVPLRDRLWFGAYRNLIAGVTTVVNHDPPVRRIIARSFPVNVLRRYGWAHSPGFDRRIAYKAAWSRMLRRPFMIHAAEGLDEASASEIDRLQRMGALASNTVLIHAIALTPRHVKMIGDAGCAVVWCPCSNHFLFGASAPISELLRRGVPVALGTDSTLSGSPTLRHEIRHAVGSGVVSARQALKMVTSEPARIFGMKDGRGTIRPGGRADVVAFSGGSAAPSGALLDGDLALVLAGGRVRLARRDLAERLGLPLSPDPVRNFWMYGDLPHLMERLATRVGRETLQEHSVWNLLADAAGKRELESDPTSQEMALP